MKQPTRVVESHEVSRNGSRVCGAVVSGCSACTLECGVVPGMRSCARLDVVPTPSYVCYITTSSFSRVGGAGAVLPRADDIGEASRSYGLPRGLRDGVADLLVAPARRREQGGRALPQGRPEHATDPDRAKGRLSREDL